MKKYERNMKKYEYEGIMKKYEGYMKKYEGNMKKYVGNIKIWTLPAYEPWDLEKFRAKPLISGRGWGSGGEEWFAISRFKSTPQQRHETCQFHAGASS